jgi:hypothetical protein
MTAFSFCCYAQEPDIVLDELNEIPTEISNQFSGIVCVYPIEKQAQFPGGIDSLYCFLESKWDKELISSYRENGKVIVQFIVDSIGNIEDVLVNPDHLVQLAKLLTFVTDERIIEQVYKSFTDLPIWTPTSLSGINVKSQWRQMINFPYKYRCQED